MELEDMLSQAGTERQLSSRVLMENGECRVTRDWEGQKEAGKERN
jgi:hypothetical protein